MATEIPDVEFEQALKKSPLAPATRQNYLSRLNVIRRLIPNKSLWDIIMSGDEAVKAIINAYPSRKTQKGFLITIMALWKYLPELKDLVPKDIWRIWATSYNETNDRIEEDVMLNIPSERQKEGYVPFDEFKKRVYDLPKKGIDRLLVAMYSLIEPLRGDYNAVRIYKGKLPVKDREDNYIHIKSTGEMQMRIGEHKTSTTYGAIETDLPKELAEIIRESLKADPRDWLFTDKGGQPLTANAFVKLVARRFAKIYDKPLTINILRHSYVNSLDLNSLSIAERQKIARQMGHDWIRQEQYKLIMEDRKKQKEAKKAEE